MKALIVGVLATMVFTGSAFADQYDWRQHRQAHRIYNGAASGELTVREQRQLMRGQHRIYRAERRAERDGYVSPAERQRLRHMQNRQSHKIYNKKHNYQSTW